MVLSPEATKCQLIDRQVDGATNHRVFGSARRHRRRLAVEAQRKAAAIRPF